MEKSKEKKLRNKEKSLRRGVEVKGKEKLYRTKIKVKKIVF